MKIGSLFSGIGGLELGLERAIPGAHTVWQVEQDPYARAVLAKHWPEARRYEDVKEVGAHNLNSVDIICGGFPCQDISFAGTGAGLDGARSGLWTEYARIVRELRPRYVVVENVAALLSRGMGRVLGDLAALGYDATWDCVPAAAVGAPHRRDRLFLVAYANSFDPVEQSELLGRSGHAVNASRNGPRGKVECEACGELWCEQCESHYALCGCAGGTETDVIDCVAEPYVDNADVPRRFQQWWAVAVQAQHAAAQRSSRWAVEPDVGRVANGVPRRVDRLRCLGNAVVPQVAEVVGRVIVDLDQRMRLELDGGRQ